MIDELRGEHLIEVDATCRPRRATRAAQIAVCVDDAVARDRVETHERLERDLELLNSRRQVDDLHGVGVDVRVGRAVVGYEIVRCRV